MNLEKANLAIKVSIERANVIGAKFCIAVMDAGVNLVAFSRMDGGRVGTIDVAMKKVEENILKNKHLEGSCELLRRKIVFNQNKMFSAGQDLCSV